MGFSLKKTAWVDSHSHLADRRWQEWGEAPGRLMERAIEQGIEYFLQGGVDPEDWQRQWDLSQQYPQLGPVFGLHPYFVAAHEESDCEKALDELARWLPKAKALGETGLDFRPHISQGSEERQIAMFESQLELSSSARLPLVLHVVRAFDEALKVVDLFLPSEAGGAPRGMVHAFNGSLKQAEAWIERGFLISVGGAVCRHDNQKLHQAVRGIPLESLLIETDSPDQKPEGWEKPFNEPLSLFKVGEAISLLRNVTTEEVRDKTRDNFQRMLNAGKS